MRRAFNLMMAIFMILILSGAAVLTLKYVSISAKHITDSYIKEQAEIFMQSVIEATILKIQGYDRTSGNCLKRLTFYSSDNRFIADVNITTYYLYHGKDNDKTNNYCGSSTKAIDTEESHGYVIIEAVVETNSSHPKIKDFVMPVRLTKRTLQRP